MWIQIKAILKKMTEILHEIAFVLLLNDKESHILQYQLVF